MDMAMDMDMGVSMDVLPKAGESVHFPMTDAIHTSQKVSQLGF
jgi:hypothetical protein